MIKKIYRIIPERRKSIMKRFTIFALVVLALFAFVLVGCGGKQDTKAPAKKAEAPKAVDTKAAGTKAADTKAADTKAPEKKVDPTAPVEDKKENKQLKGLFQH